MQVTISLLPVSLSLVHIPRSRLSQLSHPLLRQILQPNPAFLNITCNDIELSIFAEHHMLTDFDPVARKDRQRQRSSSTSSSTRRGTVPTKDVQPVEISYEKWSVLQIDSHNDQLDNSGARVHELSAPLAAAGISILYQSSYMSDFIFVKESRLHEAMSLFSKAGFDLYSSDNTVMSSRPLSPPQSPTTDDQASVLKKSSSSSHVSGAVLTRSRSSTDTSLASGFQNSCSVSHNPHMAISKLERVASAQPPPLRSKSQSPTSAEVRILGPDLACVGLSEEFGVDHWGLKIVKLVAFPDLIPSKSSQGYLHFASENPSFLHSSPTSPRSPFLGPYSPVSLKLKRPFTPSTSSTTSDDEGDGYFSHSPENISTLSLTASTSHSSSDLPSILSHSSPFKPSSKHLVSSFSPLRCRRTDSSLSLSINTKTRTYPSRSPEEQSRVPFFSFTRTPEGSSLTADVSLLATLFPPHERHMVICSGELDAADEHMDGADSDDEDGVLSGPSSLKCLQIDLRRFGLDKHGLVNRFSRVLEQNGINHMYSSTFKTANLLVDKKLALRAQSLLRAC